MLISACIQRADCKRGRRKGATSKNVKNRQKWCQNVFSTLFDNFRAGQKTSKIVRNRQKVFRHFSTIFAQGKKRQKSSKIVKKCQKYFPNFSTIFARHLFSGPFCNPLNTEGKWGTVISLRRGIGVGVRGVVARVAQWLHNEVHHIAAFAFAMAIPRCQWRHRCVVTLGKFLVVLYSKPLWRKEKWKQRAERRCARCKKLSRAMLKNREGHHSDDAVKKGV